MKQLVQDLRTGQTRLEEVPTPVVGPGQVLIRTRRTLISPGTERMLVSFSRAGWISRARQQPERVRQVLDKVRTDGWQPTLAAIRRKLDQPIPLGYCNVGEVEAVGAGVTDLCLGQRVVSNGPHADVVSVPRNLVAPIPDNVTDDDATFTVIGAIALQGIRLANPTLGETVVVMGLGLIGLLTADLLRIHGCRVIGFDLSAERVLLARNRGVAAFTIGAETDPANVVMAQTAQVGADAVLLTTATQSDAVMTQAARMSRKRGRVVLVGTAGLHLNRADFYEKELSFQVSCAYGPGRYDPVYEQQGHDYPLPFVRWTEGRNFGAVLHLLSTGQLAVRSLITDVVPIDDYARVYEHLDGVATIFKYESRDMGSTTLRLRAVNVAVPTHRFGNVAPSLAAAGVGLIGAGNFVQATILPALAAHRADLRAIASAGGLSGTRLARQYQIPVSTTDYQTILDDETIGRVVIATRHGQHATLAADALRAGKHVFVEKPLALWPEELAEVLDGQYTSGRTLMVGYNRRFSPLALRCKQLLDDVAAGPLSAVITINAGAVAATSWLHDRHEGGGRLLGEACHWVDLLTYWTGSLVESVCLNATGPFSDATDTFSLLLRYVDGSTGVINYFATGSAAYAKERMELFVGGRTLVLDNFRELRGWGFRTFLSMKTRQNKGHHAQFGQWLASTEPLIPLAELANTSWATLAALQSGREGRWVNVAEVETTLTPEFA